MSRLHKMIADNCLNAVEDLESTLIDVQQVDESKPEHLVELEAISDELEALDVRLEKLCKEMNK